ncbi:MAG: hypothetical protein K2Q23_06120, partial [Bryobacteraceae bacterium]|nr:hypothetical protein [Bryobacteraceae bacterium]
NSQPWPPLNPATSKSLPPLAASHRLKEHSFILEMLTKRTRLDEESVNSTVLDGINKEIFWLTNRMFAS